MSTKKHYVSFLLVVSISILFFGCATSSKSFKTSDVKPDEGIFLGNIKIFIDGEDFTKHCYIGFNGNNKPYINLDESGDVIGKAKIGITELTYVTCLDMGLISVTHSCTWHGTVFSNVGKGKQTYFGNIVLNWSPSGTGAKKAATFLTGGLGAGALSGVNSCGKQEFTIVNTPEKIRKTYRDIDPTHVSIQSNLISGPKWD
jgi:hypothetical protein